LLLKEAISNWTCWKTLRWFG